MGQHAGSSFPKWLAVTFAATFVLAVIHVLVTVEWSGSLAVIARSKALLRPATWPPATHLLPIGAGWALWRLRRGVADAMSRYALAIIALGAGLFVAFQYLPTYLPPGLLGVTRPALVLAPLLWAGVGAAAWRLRALDRLAEPLAWMAGTLFLANAVMLYSRAPADGPAMVAHLGRVGGYLVLLLSAMQMASRDMRERIGAEAALSRLNAELDQRVVERTVQLQAANATLEAEMRARRQSQRLLEAVIENSPAVIYVKDLEGRYLMVNHRYADIFHIDRDAMIGRTDHDIFPKDVADAFRAMDVRVAAADLPLTEQESAPHDDGPHAYISVKSPLRDDAGQAYGVFGISTDITEHKRAQDALAASEERTRLIIETALDAVVTMDSAGRITGWSPQAEKIFGWTRQRGRGAARSKQAIIPQRCAMPTSRAWSAMWRRATPRSSIGAIEITALHRDGLELPIELVHHADPHRRPGHLQPASSATSPSASRRRPSSTRNSSGWACWTRSPARSASDRTSTASIRSSCAASRTSLPVDFACLCLYDDVRTTRSRSRPSAPTARRFAIELALMSGRASTSTRTACRAHVSAVAWSTSRISPRSTFPFPRRLAHGGFRSMVVRAATDRKQGLRRVDRCSFPARGLRQRRMRVPAPTERARRTGRSPSPAAWRVAGGL
jgi:PAS domain S-box-containing protein